MSSSNGADVQPGGSDDSRPSGGRFWVWVFDDRHGLDWVLRSRRMAFPDRSHLRASRIRTGDQAIFYATSTVIGRAQPSRFVGVVTVLSDIQRVPPFAIEGLSGRMFDSVFEIEVAWNLGEDPNRGVVARDIVRQLSFIKDTANWGQSLRRSPVEISAGDFEIIRELIDAARDSPAGTAHD